MSPLFTLLRRDALLMVRDRFLHVGLVVALLLGLLTRFVLPESLQGPPTYFVEPPGLGLLDTASAEDLPPEQRLTSETALREALAQDPEATGIVLGGTRAQPTLRLITHDSPNPHTLALQETAAWALIAHLNGQLPTPRVLHLRGVQTPLPFRFALLPLILTADALFLGFLFGAVMVSQERSDRTLHAYRVTPGGAALWVLSKALVNAAASVIYATALVLVAGASLRWGLALGVVFVGSAALTLGGMTLAVYFRSLNALLYPLLVCNMVLLLPLGVYFMPGADLPGIQLLPTWAAMLGLREAMSPQGGALTPVWLGLGPWLVGLGAICVWSVQNRLMKEQG